MSTELEKLKKKHDALVEVSNEQTKCIMALEDKIEIVQKNVLLLTEGASKNIEVLSKLTTYVEVLTGRFDNCVAAVDSDIKYLKGKVKGLK